MVTRTLPHNVLVKIATKANARTQVRLRATSKTLYADPMAATKRLRRGFAYGTGGALQKEYNQMPKRLRKLGIAARLLPQPLKTTITDKVFWLELFVNASFDVYRQAVRNNAAMVEFGGTVDLTEFGTTPEQLFAGIPGATTRLHFGATLVHVLPREKMMAAVLRFAVGVVRELEAQVAAPPNLTRRIQRHKRAQKQARERIYGLRQDDAPGTAAAAAARRVARRAARRVAA